MAKILAVAVLALALSGCAVATVAGAAVDVASTAVGVTTDIAGSAVRTVTGSSSDEKPKD